MFDINRAKKMYEMRHEGVDVRKKLTYSEIGKIYGITRGRVYQILQKYQKFIGRKP